MILTLTLAHPYQHIQGFIISLLLTYLLLNEGYAYSVRYDSSAQYPYSSPPHLLLLRWRGLLLLSWRGSPPAAPALPARSPSVVALHNEK